MPPFPLMLLSAFQSLMALQQVRISCSHNNHLCIAQKTQNLSCIQLMITLVADGSDFLLPTELTFNDGAMDGTIRNSTIDILGDDVVEGTESFIITGSAARLCPNQFVANIIIMDNDCK